MQPDNKDIIEEIRAAGLNPPEMLTLMITQGCNLRCTHCLLDCTETEDAAIAPKEAVKRILADFHELGGREIMLTGGEPLTHPDLMEILDYACRQSNFTEVALQTNAVLINEEIIEEILKLPAERLVLQISLDGARSETNDPVRGKGSFKAVMSALNLLNKSGLAENTRIAFTEMRHNYDDLPDLLNLANNLGLRQVISGTLVKGGRSLKHDEIVLPSCSQIRALIERYRGDSSFRELYERKGKISAIEWYKGRGAETGQVCRCISTPFINASGRMYPCVMYLNEELAVSGIHEDGMKKGILKGLEKWSNLPLLGKRRSETLAVCRDCRGKNHCKGGCIGRAHAVNGDPMTVEDRCGLRREVYYLKTE